VAPGLFNAQDTWGRLRRGFALPPLTHELATAHAQRFAQTNFMDKRADRLRLYLPLIVAELESRRMPLELALLPLVESSLNPQARSPVGALGTWQFMQPTANRFELRTSRLVDDRKNLLAATRAAMDYLQKLHAMFGDWHLAMAAYNWGEGRVQTAVKRQRARGLPTDFNALAPGMPAEKRNYVPQIDALRRLVDNPAAWGTTLPELPDGHPLEEVAITADIDLSLVLRFAGLTERNFLALNPAAKPPVVLGSATPRLLMPDDAARRFEAAMAAHQGKLSNWSVIKLTSTRPVEAIASQHGTSAAAVREANGITRGMKPLAGSVLLLPVAPQAGSRADEATVATAGLALAPDVVRVTTTARHDESLAQVARRVGVDTRALAAWNRIGPKKPGVRLREGLHLQLWVPREGASQFNVAPKAKPKRAPKPAAARKAGA